MNDEVYATKRIGRVLQYHIVLRLLNLLLGFVFQIVLVKNLSSAGFATYAILLAVVMLSQMALSFGVCKTISRFVPDLTVNRRYKQLAILLRRILLVRLASLILFGCVLMAGWKILQGIFPIQIESWTIIWFGVWFCTYIAFLDAEALAQSWTAHLTASSVASLDILVRLLAIAVLIRSHDLNIDSLTTILGLSSALALCAITARLIWLFLRLKSDAAADSNLPLNLSGSEIPLFAVANYLSLVSWGVSSPPIIRLVAATGLQVIPLAAFSFAQGLLLSVQRALPAVLLLPGIEPLLNAKFAMTKRHDQLVNALSLVFKLDLICTAVLLIFVIVAGPDIFILLAKREYAEYHFVFPGLLVLLELNTMYLILEVIANVNLRNRIFGMLWPIGILSVGLVFLTVSRWGIWSVLVWPIADGLLKLGILLYAFRRDPFWRVLDPARSGWLFLNAILVVALAALYKINWPGSLASDVVVACCGIAAFIGSLFVLQPFRPPEHRLLAAIVPPALGLLPKLMYWVSGFRLPPQKP